MNTLPRNVPALPSCPTIFAGPASSKQSSRRMFTLSLLALLCSPLNTLAQTASNKTIRIIVTAAPGGSDDFQGRLVAQGLTEVLGQSCIVENRAGGGGMIGREFVARSAPDGYTLLLAASSLATVPTLRPSAKLDVIRDFTPISMISRSQLVLLVHPAVPAKSVAELVALAKANPGKLTFGSSGAGLIPHLSGELFKSMAGVNIVHVPYQGSSPVYVDLMAGRIDMAFGVVASALQPIRVGHVRALAVTSTKRSPMLPEVATMVEAGIAGYDLPSWMSIVGPAGVPPDVVARLNSAVKKVMASPETRKRMFDAGLEPEASTPEQLSEQLRNDVTKLRKIIGDAGIKLE